MALIISFCVVVPTGSFVAISFCSTGAVVQNSRSVLDAVAAVVEVAGEDLATTRAAMERTAFCLDWSTDRAKDMVVADSDWNGTVNKVGSRVKALYSNDKDAICC
jgi:hypothetical protein